MAWPIAIPLLSAKHSAETGLDFHILAASGRYNVQCGYSNKTVRHPLDAGDDPQYAKADHCSLL